MIARRRLIGTAALAALPGGAWLLDRWGAGESIVARLAGLIERRADAQALGRAYLRLHPEEAAPEPLVEQLLPGAGRGSESLRRLTTSDLREAARRQRERDFARGDTVVIDGWILARTEARLCALTLFA